MGNLGYIFKRLRTLNYKAMGEKIAVVQRDTGRSKLAIFYDMQACARKYGAGYMDYELFELYNVPKEQRDTYLTRGRNNQLVIKYCDKSFLPDFVEKDRFNERFSHFLHREWLKVQTSPKEDVLAFMEKHKRFMVKEIVGSCGKGVHLTDISQHPSLDALYDTILKSYGDSILEQLIVQHPEVSSIYPHAINTLRVVTIVTTEDGKSILSVPEDKRHLHPLKSHVICVYFRIGNGGNSVDNFNSGGMVAPVDEKTGIVTQVAIDKAKNIYETHPTTGTAIKGFQFPHWDKVIALCSQASLVIPEMGYAGWDVAVTPDGAVFVEGNEFPGHDLYQLPAHTPDKIGIMSKFTNLS